MHPLARRTRRLLPFAGALLSAAAHAQTPTVLIRTGGSLSIEGQIQTITELRSTDASACGGYGCSLRTSGPLGGVDAIWGSLLGGAPGVLRAEGTAAGYLQVAFDDYFELSAEGVAHGAASQDVSSGQTGIHAAWIGGDPIAVTGTPAPGGKFWRSIEDAGATLDGRRWFRASLSDVAGGGVAQRGLFVEDAFGNLSTVVVSGATYPNFPAPLTNGAVAATARFSTMRGRWIAPVWLNLNASQDAAMIADGAGLLLGGSLVHEFVTIPPSVGGIGDRWDAFEWCGINEAGDWFFSGRSAGVPGNLNGFLCRNDGIWQREGDEVDGETLAGEACAADLNPSGELAYVWGVEDGSGGVHDALFVEETRIAKAGDAVDWDGDGTVDAGATIVRFRDGMLSIGASGDVYAIVQIDGPDGLRDALVLFSRTLGTNYCDAATNLGGGPASISAHGSLHAADNDLTLRCASMPQQSFGFFLVSQTQGFASRPGGSAGNLCLGGAIGRFQQNIQSSGLGAVIEIDVDLTSIPKPTGPVAVTAGQTWSFSTWFRDVEPQGAATSNFSNAIELTFE